MRFIRQFGVPRPEKPPTNRVKEVWIPLGSIIVALAAIFAQVFSNYQNQKAQADNQYNQLMVQSRLKLYELSFNRKHEVYLAFMKAADEYCRSETTVAEVNAGKLRSAFYSIEPFLSYDARREYLNKLGEMQSAYNCGLKRSKNPQVRSCNNVLWFHLHNQLWAALFRDNASNGADAWGDANSFLSSETSTLQ